MYMLYYVLAHCQLGLFMFSMYIIITLNNINYNWIGKPYLYKVKLVYPCVIIQFIGPTIINFSSSLYMLYFGITILSFVTYYL